MTPLPVVCIEEADWEPGSKTELTVSHLFQLLAQDGWITFQHLRVNSKAQLQAGVREWVLAEPNKFKFVYLNLHGLPGGVYAGKDEVPLQTVADWLDGGGSKRIFHFSSCEVLKDRHACGCFVKNSKARAMCGYTTKVGWLAPVAFELLLIAAVSNEPRETAELALEDVRRKVRALAKPPDFKVIRHADSPRYVPEDRPDLPGI